VLEVEHVGVGSDELVRLAAVAGEADDDEVVGISVRERGELSGDRRPRRLTSEQQLGAVSERVGEPRVKRTRVPLGEAELVDVGRLVAVDPDEDPAHAAPPVALWRHYLVSSLSDSLPRGTLSESMI
jgi:hypothetical protein